MKKINLPQTKLLIILAAFLSLPLYGQSSSQTRQTTGLDSEVRKKALKVEAILNQIEKASNPVLSAERFVEITEDELNAYICHLIELDEGKYVKSLNLKVFPKNIVEGKLTFYLRNVTGLAFLESNQDIIFRASFISEQGKIKIKMEKVWLGLQPVSADLLNSIVRIISQLEGSSSQDLEAWWALPEGVKRLEAFAGKIRLFY